MEQLKKVLEYKFWIILAVAIITPLVGWFLGHSAMAKEYNDGVTKLDGIYKGIPQGPDWYNASWADKAGEINKQQDDLFNRTHQAVYDEQQKVKVWPAGFLSENLEAAGPEILSTYPPKHVNERLRVWRLIRPREFQDDTMSWRGVIDCPLTLVPDVKWPRGTPTAKMIRDTQEDLWLTAAIFESLDRVNAGYETANDAPIRKLVEFVLRGGGGPKGGSAGGAPGGQSPMGGMGAMGAMAAMASAPPVNNDGAGDGFGVSGGQNQVASKFNPDDEFGTEREDSAGAPAPTASSAAANPMGGMAMAVGMPTVGGAEKIMFRDVEKTEYYWTRGFYLTVIMDHNAVPKLLVELSNSPNWPIRVTRVQQTDVVQSELVTVDESGASTPGQTPGMVGAGMPGGGMPMVGSPFGRNMAPMPGMVPMGNPVDNGFIEGDSPMGRSGQSANVLSDPKLAYVSLSGLITIYLPPAATAAPASPTAPTTPPVAQTPMVTPAATTATAPMTGTPADGTPMPMATAAGTPMPMAGTAPSDPAGAPAAPMTPAASTPPATPAATPPAATPPAATPPATTPGEPPAPTTPAPTTPAETKPGETKPAEAPN